MVYVALIASLVVAAAATWVLCTIFRVDFSAALRAHWRRGFTRGRGLWGTFAFVAMVALVADPEATAAILEFIHLPGREAEARGFMPRAIGVFVGAAVFVLAANVVLQAALRAPTAGSRRAHHDHEPP